MFDIYEEINMKMITMEYQPFILFILGAICCYMAVFTSFIKFHEAKIKYMLIKMELSTMALLVSYALTYTCDGMNGIFGYSVVYFVNACSFFMNCLILYCYNEYLVVTFMQKGKLEKIPKSLKCCYILSVVWTLVLAIFSLTGWLFTVNSDNCYQSGPLFFIAGTLPLVVLFIQLSYIIRNRKMINKKLAVFLIIADICLIISSAVQIFPWGAVVGQVAIFCMSTSLFGIVITKQNGELRTAAFTEMETGLLNTYGFLYKVNTYIRHGKILAYNAFYFDIVGMSNINSKFGNDKGSEIIRLYVEYIGRWLQEGELFARFGGNYFLALVKKERTNEFLEILADTPIEIKINNKKILVSISSVAGVYEIDENTKKASQVLEKTSAAVAYAKNVVNEPYVFINEELEKKIHDEKALMEEIHMAFKESQFEPFYQPKVETNNHKLYGSEALVRWRKDDKIVPPFKFIPLMEKKCLICKLDFYVLEHVCMDMREWIDKGLNPPCVSVNFSRKNLSNKTFAEDIHDTLIKYDIPVNLIQIEITETNDGYSLEDLKEAVDKLHEYGFSVAIDDFGTGSSSISLLKEVTFDVLKIDKTFVDYKDEKEKKLLSYIIDMAKAIDIGVIAEGVEDMNHVNALKDMDCVHIQGYVFDKPLAKDEYEKRIEKQKYDV